jgi:hypothetical protein
VLRRLTTALKQATQEPPICQFFYEAFLKEEGDTASPPNDQFSYTTAENRARQEPVMGCVTFLVGALPES